MTDISALVTALADAAGEVKRLAKENKNTEQKYEFASIDDFLAMTGPICAKHGLIVLMDEIIAEPFEKQGKYGATAWVKYTFAITVYHKAGASLPPVNRSVEVIRSGAQAAGSAQSYVLKQFLRGLFQIPTGDKDDPDYGTQQEVQVVKSEPKSRPQTRPITADEYQAMKALMDETNTTDEAFAKHLGVSDLMSITDHLHGIAMAKLREKKARMISESKA